MRPTLLTTPLQHRTEAAAKAVIEYCKVSPLFTHHCHTATSHADPSVSNILPCEANRLLHTYTPQNPFEGFASFPVLREFQSPCACGTSTQEVDRVPVPIRAPIFSAQAPPCRSCSVRLAACATKLRRSAGGCCCSAASRLPYLCRRSRSSGAPCGRS